MIFNVVVVVLRDLGLYVLAPRSHTASYYMQLGKDLRHDSTSLAVTGHSDTTDLTTLYRDLNSVKDFILAFPPDNPAKRKAPL